MDELERAATAVLAAPVAEPTPIDRLRPRLRRRSRRRRALVALVVVSALAVPAVGIAAAAHSDRGAVDIHTIDSGGTDPSTSTSTERATTSHTLPPGARVDPDDVMAMSFVDQQHGFATYAAIDNKSGLASTNDGGATWRAFAAAPKNITALLFTSLDDGWAYGIDRFVTHDGGRSWTNTDPAGDVDALDVIGASVWSLVGCTSRSVQCVDHLEKSDDAGRTWKSSEIAGMPVGASGLLRLDAQNAYVWSAFNSGEAPPAIVVTNDGAQSWRPLKNPCGQTLAGFATVDGVGLWASCSGAGVPVAPKQLFRSHDGGATWNLVARVGLEPPDIGRLPISGYGADLIAISDPVAILTSGRGSVSVTTDGGRNWSEAVHFSEFLGTITRLAGSGTVWVASAHTCGAGCGVWKATDGIHFSLVGRGTPY